MLNYEHEIEFPESKVMRTYLWNDYFHDSEVSIIEFTGREKAKNVFFNPTTLVLTIISSRDFEEAHDWDNNKYTRAQRRVFYQEPKDQYTYLLKFSNCHYFIQETEFFESVYLNGRFKDSALLQKLMREEKKKLFHFRIQLSAGYIDIVFERFSIRKLNGRAKPEDCEKYDYTEMWLRNKVKKNFNGQIDYNALFTLLNSGTDVERSFAFSYLCRIKNMNVIESARKAISLDKSHYDFTRVAAFWAIGMQGNEDDLPLLMDEYFNGYDNSLYKRHIMDAIERVKYRASVQKGEISQI